MFCKEKKKDTGNSYSESFFLCGLNNTKQLVSFHYCVGLSFEAQSEWVWSSCSLVLSSLESDSLNSVNQELPWS